MYFVPFYVKKSLSAFTSITQTPREKLHTTSHNIIYYNTSKHDFSLTQKRRTKHPASSYQVYSFLILFARYCAFPHLPAFNTSTRF